MSRAPAPNRSDAGDPCEVVALVFAGQGAEQPGMGLALAGADPSARRLLTLASEATGVDVLRALERGGRALTRTEVLQPALVATALGAAGALRRHGLEPAWVMGHSLGEFAAACVATELEAEDAIALAATRGRLMAAAIRGEPGGMLALRLSASDTVRSLEEAGLSERVEIAAINAPDETVVSGDEAALDRLEAKLDARRLRVAGAWHSRRLRPAVAPFEAALRVAMDGATTSRGVVSACSASVVDAADLPSLLAEGLARPVRFVDALEVLRDRGVTDFVVPGSARTVGALCRRVLGRAARIHAVETLGDVDRLIRRLDRRTAGGST